MKRLGVSGLVVVVLFSGAAWVWHNRQVRQDWDKQYALTLDAFRRTAEAKDDDEVVFEPRYLDFEKSYDALKALRQPFYGDDEHTTRLLMAVKLHACGDTFDLYRRTQAGFLRTGAQGYVQVSANFKELYDDSRTRLNNCVKLGDRLDP